jgi:hypothetical protein
MAGGMAGGMPGGGAGGGMFGGMAGGNMAPPQGTSAPMMSNFYRGN